MRELVHHETGAETWGEKGLRKMKQQPLVLLGILATTVALIGAARTMGGRGPDKAKFNRWLRFRVIAQGVTVAACVAGSYVFGMEAKRKKAIEDAEQKQRDIERERARFEESLAQAVEMQRLEDEAAKSKPVPQSTASPMAPPKTGSSWSWSGWWKRP